MTEVDILSVLVSLPSFRVSATQVDVNRCFWYKMINEGLCLSRPLTRSISFEIIIQVDPLKRRPCKENYLFILVIFLCHIIAAQ